jgi:hypothetical protein
MKRGATAIVLQHQECRAPVEVRVVFDDLARGSTSDDVGQQNPASANAACGMLRNDDVPRGDQLLDTSCDLGHMPTIRTIHFARSQRSKAALALTARSPML